MQNHLPGCRVTTALDEIPALLVCSISKLLLEGLTVVAKPETGEWGWANVGISVT